ncbi:pyridoxamine kinase [Lacticaseibacillus porcinae]|uniref:pyridoxamine kinase n=1 Tax=Lacticaseibacillus porcinae TaxID=1123687 RepID=UPI000F796C7B|nr:pyridoxamine kinase [Lacticaseibacillus porcinae]
MQAKVIISQDLSGVGQVSMGVALPLIAALGHDPLPLPTALLSAHTGFANNTYFDLSAQMAEILTHWESLELDPQAILLGYLGKNALKVWQTWLPQFNDVPLVVIDPVMGDHGKLYRGFDDAYVQAMRALITHATVITPNPTEAQLLLGDELNAEPLTMKAARSLGTRLAQRFGVQVVLTGVTLVNDRVGVIVVDGDDLKWWQTQRLSGHYFGTGDIFAAVLCGALLRGLTLGQASEIAVHFESRAIISTLAMKADPKFGVAYTTEIPWLLEMISKLL